MDYKQLLDDSEAPPNCMRDGSSFVYFLKPPAKYIYTIPQSFERFFRGFDNFLISNTQRVFNKFWHFFDLSITFFTTIEFGMVLSFLFLFAGWDSFEDETTFIVLIVCILSQIPKRFIWRPRPYMVGRASPHSSPKTSSFPSRAVTCAAVYSLSWVVYTESMSDRVFFKSWTILFPLVCILLASLARIQIGAHYPSDCLIGAFNGIMAVAVGISLQYINSLDCGSCKDDSCYAGKDSPNEITWENRHLVNWSAFYLLLIIGIIITIISVVKPIRFWCKCHLVYGMLLPSIAFDRACLCKALNPNGNAALAKLTDPLNLIDLLFGLIVGGLIMIFGIILGILIKDPTSSCRKIIIKEDKKVLDSEVHAAVLYTESEKVGLLDGVFPIETDKNSRANINGEILVNASVINPLSKKKKKKKTFPLQTEIMSVFSFVLMYFACFYSALYWRSSELRNSLIY
ncbi:hypothetical protein RCL1_001709 [Eukaryota sp. TZLM3-RCL]